MSGTECKQLWGKVPLREKIWLMLVRETEYNGEIKMVDVAETDVIYMRNSPKGMCSVPTQGV